MDSNQTFDSHTHATAGGKQSSQLGSPCQSHGGILNAFHHSSYGPGYQDGIKDGTDADGPIFETHRILLKDALRGRKAKDGLSFQAFSQCKAFVRHSLLSLLHTGKRRFYSQRSQRHNKKGSGLKCSSLFPTCLGCFFKRIRSLLRSYSEPLAGAITTE